MRISVEPKQFQRFTLWAIWSLSAIVVTGAAVRLTGSGLGCPDWPTCEDTNLVSPWEYHAVIEFGNRVVTGWFRWQWLWRCLAQFGGNRGDGI